MQLLATDLDGTLFSAPNTVGEQNAAACARWRGAGNVLVPASGRSLSLVSRPLGMQQLVYDYTICASGCVVADGEANVLYNRTIAPAQLEAVLRPLLEREDCSFYCTTPQADYIVHDATGHLAKFSTDRPENGFVWSSLDEVLERGLEVSSVPVYIPNPHTADALSTQISQEFAGKLDAPRSTNYLDVVPHGVTKATALQWLVQYLAAAGRPVARTAAVGDSWNDLQLLASADMAAAMENSVDGLREAAGGHSVPSVAAYIDQLLA